MRNRPNILLIVVGCLWILTSGTPEAPGQGRGRSASNRSVVTGHWYIFKGPDGEFTLTFPTKPHREPDGQGPTTIIRSYALNTANGMRFSVNMQDAGGNPDARSNNEWGPDHETMVAAAARQNGERVVQIHRVSKNVVELELWQTVQQNGANINYLRRDILRRGRVYSLGCGSVIDGRPVDKSICRRFFNSMRFLR